MPVEPDPVLLRHRPLVQSPHVLDPETNIWRQCHPLSDSKLYTHISAFLPRCETSHPSDLLLRR